MKTGANNSVSPFAARVVQALQRRLYQASLLPPASAVTKIVCSWCSCLEHIGEDCQRNPLASFRRTHGTGRGPNSSLKSKPSPPPTPSPERVTLQRTWRRWIARSAEAPLQDAPEAPHSLEKLPPVARRGLCATPTATTRARSSRRPSFAVNQASGWSSSAQRLEPPVNSRRGRLA